MDQTTVSGGSRVERKKEETKRRIISTARELFLSQGVEGTTMEQIAAAADIAKGTLYNYFPVKEAILGEYIQRAFREKSAGRTQALAELPDTRARSVFILTQLMEGVQAQKEIFEKYIIYQTQNILSLNRGDREKSGMERLATEIIVLGQKSGEIRVDVPAGVMEDLFEFAFIEIAKQFFQDPDHFDCRRVVDECVDLFMNGVKAQG